MRWTKLLGLVGLLSTTACWGKIAPPETLGDGEPPVALPGREPGTAPPKGGALGDVPATTAAPKAEVFGHSATTLYRLDPRTKEVVVVGAFNGCDEVIDLAVDGASRIVAATWSGLYSVDPATARCTLVASGNYPNSLSFVPKGTLLPDREALVGYESGTYVRIDTESGAVTVLGELGHGFVSSGDIVAVTGGPTYLSANGPECDADGDCLVEVDPKTGSLVKNWGPLGRADVYGLAYWAGKVYGFDDAGDLIEIAFAGDKLVTTPIPLAQSVAFWGAGSSTRAPTK